MSNFDISVSFWVVGIATFLRLWAAWDFLFVIRKATSESKVKNGLAKLRKQLLWNAWILLFLDVSGLTLLIVRPFSTPEVYIFMTNALTIINSVGFKADGHIKRQIYSDQYTVQQKEFHAAIEKLEIKRGKRDVRREVARKKLNKDRRDETIKQNLKGGGK